MDAIGNDAESSIQRGVDEFENLHLEHKQVNKAESVTITGKGTFRQGNEVKIDTFNQTIQAPPAGPNRKDVLDWLSRLNFKKTYEDELERWQEGTLKSLQNPGEFQDWLKGKDKLLWCHGDGGVGKTVLVSVIIKALEVRQIARNANIGLAYLFCNHSAFNQKDSALDHSAVNLIASLVHQLAQQSQQPQQPQSLSTEVLSLYNKHNSASPATRPRLKEYESVLLEQVKSFETVYIIIDALDECREDDGEIQIRSRLLQVLNVLRPRINVMITSRDVSLESIGLDWDMPLVDWSFSTTDEDIGAYVDRRIEANERLKKYAKVENLGSEIKEAVVRQAAGMFLLARLHIGSIERAAKSRQGVFRKIRDALAALPSVLHDTYGILLRNLWTQAQEDAEIARKIFVWIIFGKEPSSLTLSIVQRALWLEEGTAIVDETEFMQGDDIKSVCHGLVRVDRQSQIIRFVHYTAEEYFSDPEIRRKYFPEAHLMLGKACIAQLSLNTYKEELRNPLYQYASRNWGVHAQLVEKSLQTDIRDFIGDIEKLRASFEGLISLLPNHLLPNHEGRNSPELGSGHSGIQPLHVAAYFGLELLFNEILGPGIDLEVKDALGWTPLRWAVVGKSDRIVILLIEHDADVLSQDFQEEPTLFWALGKRNAGRHFDSITLNGGKAVLGDILSLKSGQSFETAWPKAVELRTSDNILRMLIGKLADFNVRRCIDGRTILSIAAENWQWPTMKLLISLGAKTDQKDNFGMTPLLWALQNPRHTTTVDKISVFQDAVLHIGKAMSIHLNTELEIHDSEISEIEIEPAIITLIGEDLEAHDTDKRTALSLAAECRFHTVVATLLKRGADPNSTDNDLLTPLHWASGLPRFARVDVKELLCHQKSKVRFGNNKNQSITFKDQRIAKSEKFVRSILLLLSYGAKRNLKTTDGRTPLSFATMDGLESIATALRIPDSVLQTKRFTREIKSFEESLTSWDLDSNTMDTQKHEFGLLLLSMLDFRGSFRLQKVEVYQEARVYVRSTAVIGELETYQESQVLLDDRPIVMSLKAYQESQLLIQSTSHILSLCVYQNAKAYVHGDSEIESISIHHESKLFIQGRAKIDSLKMSQNSTTQMNGESNIAEVEARQETRLRIEATASIDRLRISENSIVFITGNSNIENVHARHETRLRIEATASIYSLRISENSIVFITGNSTIQYVEAWHRSRLIAQAAAQILNMMITEDSMVQITEACRIVTIETKCDSQLLIQADAEISDIKTMDSSHVHISGRSRILNIMAIDDSRIIIKDAGSILAVQMRDHAQGYLSYNSNVQGIHTRDRSKLAINANGRDVENTLASDNSALMLVGGESTQYRNVVCKDEARTVVQRDAYPELLQQLEAGFPSPEDLTSLWLVTNDFEAVEALDQDTLSSEETDKVLAELEDWDWIAELAVK